MNPSNNRYVSVYVRNEKEGPSCYYRIIQYINAINAYEYRINNALTSGEFRNNLDQKNSILKKIKQAYYLVLIIMRRLRDIEYDSKNNPSCIIVSREFVPRFIPKFLARRVMSLAKHVPVIWDLDDDIFSAGEISELERSILQKESKAIIVTHDYLSRKISWKDRTKCKLICTTDGSCSKGMYEKFLLVRREMFKKAIRIVWVGTSSNLVNLELALPGINEAAKQIMHLSGRLVKLTIVCNKPLKYDKALYSNLIIHNYKWNREVALKAILNSHMGIMPLRKTNISEGKGAFKLIQYLSCGVPLIASPEGFNKIVVTDTCGILASDSEEWSRAVINLSQNEDRWLNYAVAARKRYESEYNFYRNLLLWKDILDKTIKE